ncbi:hypothetical protein EA473_11025 [Natrarchaeobius chitinivorans]|uniref:DUF4345 domain-containing protein n=2 Tax=Natrarchaeobius chitinivorans TaxID=1679083 RepID=A0A3N6PCV1_NATCH|nr:hypothetical protein [Natrarchaeobius chitinivorans]RQG94695.1 hypothetical protein EA473_11025 [Natrarchaeobius chitinivorans]
MARGRQGSPLVTAALALAGVILVLVPRRIVHAAERVAFENPDAGRLRPWTVPMARLEGIVFAWLLVRGDGWKRLRTPLAALGFVMALVPRSAAAFGLEVAYENPDELEVKSWVVPVTRLLGAWYLVVGLLAGRADAPEDGDSSR